MPSYQQPTWGGPLAPLVDLVVEWQGRFGHVQGLMDSGADQTQIPNATAQALRLRKLRDKDITDANGNRQSQPVYVSNLLFDGVTFTNVVVTGSPLGVALIGRDILNQVAILDGPRLTYTLENQ